LYGIWSVTEYTVDGKPVPRLTTSESRWQRLVFDAGTITLPEPDAIFAFNRPDPNHLRLDGRLDGRPVTMSLERVDSSSFTLRSRGFHWVQEYPYFT
jgi:hypothetical protein